MIRGDSRGFFPSRRKPQELRAAAVAVVTRVLQRGLPEAKKRPHMNKKSIVVYFSESGNTQTVARLVQSLTGSDILEITTKTPYVKDYDALVEQAKKEIRAGVKPPLKPVSFDPDQYETIYLGSPNWWSTIAPPLGTFISENKLSGKTLAPFITHGGGGKGHADKDLKALCPGATVLDMLALYEDGGAEAEKQLAGWLKKIGPAKGDSEGKA